MARASPRCSTAWSAQCAPAGGEIVFDGERLDGRRTHEIARRGVLLVPEGRQVLAPLSVEDNLDLGRVALGRRRSDYDLDAVYQLFRGSPSAAIRRPAR